MTFRVFLCLHICRVLWVSREPLWWWWWAGELRKDNKQRARKLNIVSKAQKEWNEKWGKVLSHCNHRLNYAWESTEKCVQAVEVINSFIDERVMSLKHDHGVSEPASPWWQTSRERIFASSQKSTQKNFSHLCLGCDVVDDVKIGIGDNRFRAGLNGSSRCQRRRRCCHSFWFVSALGHFYGFFGFLRRHRWSFSGRLRFLRWSSHSWRCSDVAFVLSSEMLLLLFLHQVLG